MHSNYVNERKHNNSYQFTGNISNCISNFTYNFFRLVYKQYKYQPFDAPLSTHDDNKVWRRVKLWLAGRRVNLGLAEELEIAYISN